MSAVINTNLASLFAQNALNNAQGNLATSVQRLSSGLRINSARDDASGLAIAQTMAGHIKALDQSSLNAQQATNLAQTADSSLSTTQDILLRMQQLAVEGVNGSLSETQREAILTELTNLNTQINSFAAGTTYNGINLLGNSTTLNTTGLQNGAALSGTRSTPALGTAHSFTISNINVSSAVAGATFAITTPAVGQIQLNDGNGHSQIVTLADMTTTGQQSVNFSQLGISFTLTGDPASEADALAQGLASHHIDTNNSATSASLNFQVGANTAFSGDSIQISTINISTSTGDTSMQAVGTDITTNLVNAKNTNDATWSAAFEALQAHTRAALDYISGQRAVLGSNMNQLGYINSNLVAQSANEQAAKSTVVDTNYSAETANLTKGQIMQQAATAMLAQANQMPNVILSLLK